MKSGGVYIHVPFCTEKCMYCDFYSLSNREDSIDLFVKSLCKEIKLTSKKTNINWIIDSIFIGGGTPSLLSASQLEKIVKHLNQAYQLSNIKEFTIEANPGEFNENKMRDFKSIGVNRISFGFQSLNDRLLKFLTRWHSSGDCIKAYNSARKINFKNISIDMIFGIPNQSLKDWKKDLNSVVELDPEHISAYSLTVEKRTPLYKSVQSKSILMPHEEVDIQMYGHTMNRLNKDGYTQYEISNYSKKSKECKHNLHYWRREPYLAFGPSAHGYNEKQRYWNIRDLNKYIKILKSNKLPIDETETLSKENVFNEIVLNGLRVKDGINISKIKSQFDKDTFNNLSKKIDDWSNYLEDDKLRIKLNRKGYFIADEITLDLMNSYT